MAALKSAALLLALAAAPLAARAAEGALPVVRLSGAPYQLGFQHGAKLRAEVREHYAHVFAFMQARTRIPLFTRFQVDWELDRIWNQLEPFVPADQLEEMRGLADGAGVSLDDVHRVHALPDAFPAQCSLGAFYGPATAGGKFYQLRNLDWDRAFGIQRYGVVFVVSPAGKRGFVNIGFAGFIGALSGMNDRGISIGEVGSTSADETHQGTSFVFLLRRILEEAGTVDEAAAIVRDAKRTVGINYVIGSALEKKAVALETTAHHFARFGADDPAEARSPYAVPFKGAVFRADMAFDPAIRAAQKAANGDPGKTPPPSPRGEVSYDVRYLGQAAMVKARYGKIGLADVFALAKAVAPRDDIQSVIYAYPEFWASYARGDARAADGPFTRYDLNALLAR